MAEFNLHPTQQTLQEVILSHLSFGDPRISGEIPPERKIFDGAFNANRPFPLTLVHSKSLDEVFRSFGVSEESLGVISEGMNPSGAVNFLVYVDLKTGEGYKSQKDDRPVMTLNFASLNRGTETNPKRGLVRVTRDENAEYLKRFPKGGMPQTELKSTLPSQEALKRSMDDLANSTYGILVDSLDDETLLTAEATSARIEFHGLNLGIFSVDPVRLTQLKQVIYGTDVKIMGPCGGFLEKECPGCLTGKGGYRTMPDDGFRNLHHDRVQPPVTLKSLPTEYLTLTLTGETLANRELTEKKAYDLFTCVNKVLGGYIKQVCQTPFL